MSEQSLRIGTRKSAVASDLGELHAKPEKPWRMATAFPFSAIVSQDEMKLALMIAAVDPKVGGVLAFGDRGSGKSTAVRALAPLLPAMRAVTGCRYQCDPDDATSQCDACRAGLT